MKEPLFMEPIYKDYIWGGTRLKEYLGKDVETDTVAESWEISTNDAGLSKIQTGQTLKELFEDETVKEEIFGTKTKNMREFPLLIKFIDAKDNLSVQVHPDDEYALKYENDKGKTEMWYVMDCDENAKIICGIKENIKQEEISKTINEGEIRQILNEVAIHKGDVIFIPSGTIHAILKGTLICEIQQNSNLTYRVYDWDRIGKDGKPRELHIQKAIDVIKQDAKQKIVTTSNQKIDTSSNVITCNYFKVDTISIGSKYKQKSNSETFESIMVVEGNGKIQTNGKEYNVKLGDSFIIPASLGEYEIEGEIKILKAYL